LSFPIERAVFIREYSSKMYGVASYYLAKNLIETPFIVFFATVQTTITYFTTGLRGDEAKYFFIYLAAYIMHSLCAQSMGYAIGTLFTNISEAMIMVNVIVLPLLLFAGTLINESSMPVWLFWIKFLSPMKYVNEIANTNQFRDNPSITYDNGNFLSTLNYTLGMTNCFIISACMIVGLRLLGVVFLRLMVRKTG